MTLFNIVLLERMGARERVNFPLWNTLSHWFQWIIFYFDSVHPHGDLGRLWSRLIIDKAWSRSASSSLVDVPHHEKREHCPAKGLWVVTRIHTLILSNDEPAPPAAGSAEPEFELLVTEALIGALNIGVMNHVARNSFRLRLYFRRGSAPILVPSQYIPPVPEGVAKL